MTWLGHSTVVLHVAGRTILTDPVLGPGIGPVRRRTGLAEVDLAATEAVLISHLHHDHLDLPSLRRLDRTTRIVVPRYGGRLLRSEGFVDVVEVEAGNATNVGDVEVRAVPAFHDGRRHPFGPTAPALGFVVHGEDTVYFAGDTDIFPGMADIAADRELDLAILPVGGWGPTLRGGHMDGPRAAAALTLLRPRMAVAVHWGTLWPIGLAGFRRDRFEEPAREFFEEALRVAPDVTIVPLEPGGSFDIDAAATTEAVDDRS